MKKLDTSKSTWLTSLTLDFIREGTQRGVLAVHASIGSGEGSLDDISAIILALRSEDLPRARRILHISGNLRDSDRQLLLALRSARDYGFETHLLLNDETIAYAHADEATWTILRTKRNAVVAAVDEILYAPTPEGLEADFIFPQGKRPAVYLFLDPVAGLKFDDITAFLARSPYQWQVLL
jgi:hypothetical protein